MNLDLLENLIKEGNELSNTINYVPAGHDVIRTYSVYSTNEQVKYQNWISSVQRFVKTYFYSDLDDIKEASKKLSPDNHRKILGLLNAIKLLPNEPVHKEENKNLYGTSINITNNQTNSQHIILNIFLEAIKDEITGKDLKALQQIVKDNEGEPEKAKSKILEKLKSFGSDVLTNIVANIITNPNIYSVFM
jgi:hypothetical protein